jgi:molecular chaperone DnaK
MTADATAHEAEDKKKKEEIEIKNMAEQLIYTAEKAIKDNGSKVDPAIIKGVEDKISDLKKAKEGTDFEAIKKSSEALSGEMQKIGESMMKAQQAEQAKSGQTAPNQEGEAKKEDNVKDAEYKETGTEDKK